MEEKRDERKSEPVVTVPKMKSLETIVGKHFPRQADIKAVLKRRGITIDNCTPVHLRRAFAPAVANAVSEIMSELEEMKDA